MTRQMKFLSKPARLGAVAIVAAAGLAIPQARAQLRGTSVLMQGASHSAPNLDFSNSNVTGNIGIGGVGGFVGSGSGTVTGTVQFAAPNTGQFNPDGITVTGGATFGNANVQTNLNALNALSQSLSTKPGPAIALSDGGNLVLSGGNSVFTATIDPSFVAGSDFTIQGTSSQSVVFNITTGGLPFAGSIDLTGGITSDQVLFNFDAGDYATNTGGETLTIENLGDPTAGTYLDPNGAIVIINSLINGRVFGGGDADFVLTGSNIVGPAGEFPFPVPAPAPEPTSLALLGAGLVTFSVIRRRHRPLLAQS